MTNYITTMGGSEQGENRHNISFGIHRDYTREAKRLFESAKKYNLQAFYYDNDWLLNSEYYKKYSDVLSLPSFSWAFKSVIINETLKKMENGEVVLWCDSNHYIMSDPTHIIDFAKEKNIFAHEHWMVYYPNKDWSTRDMFIKMDCDEERYWNAPQMQVNIMAFCKTDFTINFVKEWMNYCLDYNTIVVNWHQNLPGFKEKRHEQSIFSILVEKYKIPYQPYPVHTIDELMGIDVNEK